ncbi:MAG: DJ-1/PfpI family protein [Clostridia bacterium]|nr:DJ-1/PfpI family protein [Clostridia bacterium]
MKVYLHLADGFEEIEAISVVDILRRAGIETQTVSITGRKEVHGVHDIKVISDILFEDADYSSADMIILPGGGPGTENLNNHTGLKEEIRNFSEQGKWLAAICAAPTVLGRLGLLQDKSAVCYPGCESNLTGANICSKEITTITDGKIITSRGPGTCLEFALKIVEALKGMETVNRLRAGMIIS